MKMILGNADEGDKKLVIIFPTITLLIALAFFFIGRQTASCRQGFEFKRGLYVDTILHRGDTVLLYRYKVLTPNFDVVPLKSKKP